MKEFEELQEFKNGGIPLPSVQYSITPRGRMQTIEGRGSE
jgi:hypothetical protein